MTGPLTIRPETEDDCAKAAALHVLAWQRGYAGMLPADYLAGLDVADWTQRRLARIRENIPRQSLIAEQDGVIVGFVIFGDKRDEDDRTVFHPETGEIYAIYVHPDHWGTGVADELMKTALDGLPQAQVQLFVLEHNHRARRFYARHGLDPDGSRHFFRVPGTEVDVPELRLCLRRQ